MIFKDNKLPLKIFVPINEGCGGQNLTLGWQDLNPVPVALTL